MVRFVSDLWQVGGFLQVLLVSSTNKTDRHDITEILLKVALPSPSSPFVSDAEEHDGMYIEVQLIWE
jgi:hypothetical protein